MIATTNKYPLPLPLARTPFFSTNNTNRASKPDVLTDYQMPCPDNQNYRLIYSGPQLNQNHSKVFQVLCMLLRENQSDEATVTTTHGEFLSKLGMPDSTHERRWLRANLKDLTKAYVDLTTDTHAFSGTLIWIKREKISINKKTGDSFQDGKLVITYNKDLIKVLSDEVVINNLQRKVSIGRSQIAMWLHDYYATHLSPPPVAVGELKRLCGSTLPLRQFRPRLVAAMDQLSKNKDPEVKDYVPLITSYSIDERDRLVVQKSATQVVLTRGKSIKAKGGKKGKLINPL